MKVSIAQYSLPHGNGLELTVHGLQLAGQTHVNVNINKVEDDYDEFALCSDCKFEPEGDTINIVCPAVSTLQPGLYLLSSLVFLSDEKSNSGDRLDIKPKEFGTLIFEIRAASHPARDDEILLKEYETILEAREQEFLKGFGPELGATNTLEFEALVFIKNCLLTRRMRLGQYELIPFEGLGCNDELDVINKFLTVIDIPVISNTNEVISSTKTGQPTVVAHFPKIQAQDLQSANSIFEGELKLLGNVLSLFRNSYSEVFGGVILERSTSKVYYRLFTPSYTGNLLGGPVSGENPRSVQLHLDKARNSSALQLYTALYREALMENQTEFVYFRFWNLLETISRSKGYVGQKLVDWNGNVLKNRNGNDREIQDSAEELVREHLRQGFELHSLSIRSLARDLQQGDVTQQIPIWYRHRNCVVHGGGCFPHDATLCNPNDSKYSKCKLAHDEIVMKSGTRTIFTDQYLDNLKQVVNLVVSWEFF